ncbi:effector-associated constant component EACC1 [Winogradskya humida]|uniref:Uncharacterized protein n=1 Tax=Winogradskya humida TaxID=113566 RepID=A0ABQ3ZTD9_9ACTN|nr:hypothetical protein [Actinoplanes humidus]GIE21819.1 hypothetical protein Ahu01nite_049210 [Actinoplanes humidus]
MTMTLQITVEGDDGDERGTPSLHRWYQDDPTVVAIAATTLIQDARGPAGVDIIEATVTDAIGAGTLLISFLQWRAARRSRIRTMAKLRHGTRVYLVRDDSPESVGEIVRDLSEH